MYNHVYNPSAPRKPDLGNYLQGVLVSLVFQGGCVLYIQADWISFDTESERCLYLFGFSV